MTEYRIDPDCDLAPSIQTIEQALIVPIALNEDHTPAGVGGVFDADGAFVASSLAFIEPHRQVNRVPEHWNRSLVEQRSGTWLFGGKHDLRFGHFLVETTSRLWALDCIDADIAGVVFLPERLPLPRKPSRRLNRSRNMLNLFAPLPPCEILTTPTRFERLVIPPQACGAGALAQGSPEFRRFVRGRLAASLKPEGARKLYISRARLANTPGHILFEGDIEKALAAEGYRIFHPQEHDLETQVAAYRAADFILGVEGSAFHLVAYAADKEAQIGVIRRRRGLTSEGITDQLTACTGQPTVALDSICDHFHIPGSGQVSNAVSDLPALAEQLREAEFVPSSFALEAKSQAQITMETDRLARQVLKGELPQEKEG